MKITFIGGASEVTGANYLLESKNTKILIDCGLHQGSNENESQNANPFPYDLSKISALLITHSHIDHTGRIAQLVKQGYRNDIYSTHPTKDATYDLLLDARHLMEKERPDQEPLYEIEDIDQAFSQWKTIKYHEIFEIGDFTIEYFNSGHILGSASILIKAEGKSIVFSGDLGNTPAPLVAPTEYIPSADYALIESAYGNRVHESVDKRQELLEDIIEDAVKSGGTLLIPAFAMERTQELLYELNDLVEHGRIPRVPIYIDSPLAIKLTATYKKYSRDSDFYNKEAINKIKNGDEIFNFPGLKFTLTTEQSKEINEVPPPKIIIAGSGMSNGGRILHHELRYLSDPKNSILFIGYQAYGTLGRKIIEKEPFVSIFGEKVAVRCKVKAIGGYSAHADQPLLLKWIESMRGSLKRVFVVQGEPEESQPLALKIKDTFAIDAIVPEPNQVIEL